jgi:hypothetical protein
VKKLARNVSARSGPKPLGQADGDGSAGPNAGRGAERGLGGCWSSDVMVVCLVAGRALGVAGCVLGVACGTQPLVRVGSATGSYHNDRPTTGTRRVVADLLSGRKVSTRAMWSRNSFMKFGQEHDG